MKPAAWVGLAVIIAALAFGAKAFVANLTPYVTFTEARRAQHTVQVMGSLDKQSIRSTSSALEFTLISKDGTGERLPVTFKQARPTNFDQAIEVTAIGKYDGQIFRAENLLVKCPTKYQGTETKEYGSASASTATSSSTQAALAMR